MSEISDHCHRLIGKFYEMPRHNVYGKKIVSMPDWLPTEDVDLIKSALKEHAERNG